jgi:hypothetical protein
LAATRCECCGDIVCKAFQSKICTLLHRCCIQWDGRCCCTSGFLRYNRFANRRSTAIVIWISRHCTVPRRWPNHLTLDVTLHASHSFKSKVTIACFSQQLQCCQLMLLHIGILPQVL